MTLAMVKVLPEPVTPSSTWCFSPAPKTLHQLGNRPRLISPRLVAGHQFKVHGKIIREGRRLSEDKDGDF
jgi:hypothetical protein